VASVIAFALVVLMLRLCYDHVATGAAADANVVVAANVEFFVCSTRSIAARAVARQRRTASPAYAERDMTEKDTG